MDEQAKRLETEGRYAFSVPLESLDSESLTCLLGPSAGMKFEAWKSDGSEPGWFFLDAVDELKLTNGKLYRALRRFSRDIAGQLGRTRVFISCRPSDCRPSLDLTTVQSWLPVQDEVGEVVAPEPEQVFMAAFQRESAKPVQLSHRQQSEPAGNTIRTFAMLPMRSGQVMEFAKHRGIDDVGGFLRR